DGIVEKAEKKLPNWKAQYLSLGGRVTAINSVLNSLPTTLMSLLPILAKVAKRLDKLGRDSLWIGNKEESTGSQLLDWEVVQLDKRCGGLGIRDLRRQSNDEMGTEFIQGMLSRGVLIMLLEFMEHRCGELSETFGLSCLDNMNLKICRVDEGPRRFQWHHYRWKHDRDEISVRRSYKKEAVIQPQITAGPWKQGRMRDAQLGSHTMRFHVARNNQYCPDQGKKQSFALSTSAHCIGSAMGIFAYNVNVVSPNFVLPQKPLFISEFPLPQVLINPSRRRSITLEVAFSMTENPAVQKKITVLNQHNEKLVGVLHDTGSMEIVVLCHGFRSSKDFNTMVNLAGALEKEGISVFRFDFPGNGESEGSFQYGNYRSEADDLHSVVEYFNGANLKVTAVLGHSKGVSTFAKSYATIGCDYTSTNTPGSHRNSEAKCAWVRVILGWVTPGKSLCCIPPFSLNRGSIGNGLSTCQGGNVVLLYASKYHDVHTVINLSGRYNLEKGIAERLGKDFLKIIKKDSFIDVKNRAGNVEYRVTEESLMDRLNTNMHDACLQIDKGCRLD
ncbi:hypothetical protein MTR67_031615, partial [Solanum verrucosum]